LIRPSSLHSTFFPVHHSFIILPFANVQSKLLTASKNNPTLPPKVFEWLVLMLHIQEVTSFYLDPEISYPDKVFCCFLPHSFPLFMVIPIFNVTPQVAKSCGWRMFTIQSNNRKMEWFKLYILRPTNMY
jgi:hypothetical protein